MSTSTALVIPGIQDAKKLALITPESASSVVAAYTPHFASFLELEEKAKSIAVNAPAAAKRMRLDLRKVRVEADKSRKSLGEEGRRYVEAVNEVYNLLEGRLSPIEERMESIEKAEERAEAERKAALKGKRVGELTPYADCTFYDLAGMPEMQYQALLTQSKNAFDAQQLAIQQAEEKRLADEAAKEQERIRLATENAKLQAEAAIKQKALDDAKKIADDLARKADEERKKADAETARLKAESDAKLAAQAKAAAAEAARVKKANDDKLAKEAADRAAKDKADQAERDRVKAAEDAKAKAERDALACEAEAAKKKADELVAKEKARQAHEAEAKAQADREAKQAAAAPDKAKLLAFVKAIDSLSVPKLTTNGDLNRKLADQTAKFSRWVESEAAKL